MREIAVQWLLYLFMNKQAATALCSKIALKSKSSRKPQRKRIPTRYCEVGEYLLETYVTNNVSYESDAEILRFTKPLNKTSI